MERFDLVVIGGGAAGITAAKTAADLGARVALVDRGPLGGLCINRGCIPKKALVTAGRLHRVVREAAGFASRPGRAALDWEAVIERQNQVIDSLRPSPADLEKRGVRVWIGMAGSFRLGLGLGLGLRFRLIGSGLPVAVPVEMGPVGATRLGCCRKLDYLSARLAFGCASPSRCGAAEWRPGSGGRSGRSTVGVSAFWSLPLHRRRGRSRRGGV